MSEPESPQPSAARSTPPAILYREGEPPVTAMRFFAALCGNDARLPLDQWQSPKILAIIERENFPAEAAKFQTDYRSLFLAVVYEPAQAQIIRHLARQPESPLCIEDFFIAYGALYSLCNDGDVPGAVSNEQPGSGVLGTTQPDLPLPPRPLSRRDARADRHEDHRQTENLGVE